MNAKLYGCYCMVYAAALAGAITTDSLGDLAEANGETPEESLWCSILTALAVKQARQGDPLMTMSEVARAGARLIDTPSRDMRQATVREWVRETFGEISMVIAERVQRVLEEACELAQAEGMGVTDAHTLVDYVWARPSGRREQELGGLQVTILAYAAAAGLSAEAAEVAEVERVLGKDPADFRRRQNEKVAAGIGHKMEVE